MAIDFENDNPYAPPQSSGEITYDGNINSQALQYLRSAGKWALFYAIMTALLILISLFGIQSFADIIGLLINIVIYGMLAFFAWKYAQNAKLIQTNTNTEQLAQCTSPLNTILIINGVLFIIGLVIISIAFLFGIAVAIAN
ncbi:MAG: hypothetical protein J5680_05995 [Neisseriaceae bacterium]|nr:hypothetical protein [Neisseriaceae bacterium]